MKSTPTYDKLSLSLRYYLHGRGYHRAIEAFALGREHHSGLRKDDKTPEFQHQVEIALHVTTLRDVLDEEGTIITALLHDVQEDYGVSSEELARRFGDEVAISIWRCAKKFKGVEKSKKQFFAECAQDHRSSLVKGCDRVHNFQTMVGVFTEAKQRAYLTEGVDYFLPMLKQAAYNFPQQQLAYMNVRQVLKRQAELIRHALTVMEEQRKARALSRKLESDVIASQAAKIEELERQLKSLKSNLPKSSLEQSLPDDKIQDLGPVTIEQAFRLKNHV